MTQLRMEDERTCETLGMVVNVVPEFVEWKRPLSVETQTSPVMLGWTAIFTGEVDEPRVPTAVKVLPMVVER